MAGVMSAMDRLKRLMNDSSDDEPLVEDSISIDEDFADVEAAIRRKDEPTESTQIQELTLDNVDDVSFAADQNTEDSSEYGEQTDDEQTDEQVEDESSSDEPDEPVNDESVNDETDQPAKTATNERSQKITIDVNDTGDDSGIEELFNNNAEPVAPQPRRGRGRRKKNNDVTPTPKPEVVVEKPVEAVVESAKNPLYDQLAHNLLDDLKRKKYSFMGLNEDSMQILLSYIQNKL